MPKECVFCEVGTEILNTEKNFMFNAVKWFYSLQYQQHLQNFLREPTWKGKQFASKT